MAENPDDAEPLHAAARFEAESDPHEGVHAGAHPQGAQQEYTLPNREETYALLRDAAHHLMSLEPHSPAPYMVLQAVAWGEMDARELYGELFVKRQGKVDLFEVMGGSETR